tara:strand:+ start:2267 stop:2605 length:339 start_codon:yes stop_codon:yes gene_type:complete
VDTLALLMISDPPITKPRTSIMNIQELCRQIVSNVHSREDLDAIYRAAKVVGDRTAYVATTKFLLGDKVFFHSKTRGLIKGHVTKINKKTIKVTSNEGVMWTVHPELLTAQG